MNRITLAVAAVFGALAWLATLVATSFNGITISVGLLAALYVTDASH